MGFAGILRQSTAVDVLIGPFVSATDGDTEMTALTISQGDVLLSKNGQTGAQKNDNTAAAHDADGMYNCELDATDTNTVGQLTLWVHEATALLVRHDFQVIEEAVYDQLFEASAPGASTPTAVAAIATTIGAAGAGLTALATQASVDTIDNLVDDLESRLGTPSDLGSGASVAANLVDIEIQTDDIGAAGAGLTAINLPNQTMDIVGNITGNLSGSVGSVAGNVDGSVASVVGAVGSVTSPVTAGTVTDKTGYRLSATGVSDILRTALTEAYNADGSPPTVEQALHVIMQRLLDFAITGTAISVKKLDGTTEAYTLLLDDDTNPTSSARNG